jgi:hypothetical protein
MMHTCQDKHKCTPRFKASSRSRKHDTHARQKVNTLSLPYLGARLHNLVELVIDDLPLGVDDRLVLQRVGETDLGAVLLVLELELDVEQNDQRVDERLGLLLKTGVGKGLLEGDALDEEGLLRESAENRHTYHK